MDVLDVLEQHIHRDFAEVQLRDHQYSFCALMIRKMCSTSATLFPSSGQQRCLDRILFP